MNTPVISDFKETEFGLVPANWTVKPLDSVLILLQNGLTEKQTRHGGNYAVTRIETISQDRINPDKVGYIDQLTDNQKTRFQLQSGDILFSHINSDPQLGRSVVYKGHPHSLFHGMNLLRLKVKSSELDSCFLNYLFVYYRELGVFIKIASRSVNQSSINQSKLGALNILGPPLPEQRRIAAVLNAIQGAIAVQDDVIAAAQAFKRSLMQRLFTYGSGQEPAETKETKIGEIPAHWEVHTLGELCDEGGGLVQTGPFGSQLHAFDYVDKGIPTVMPQDIVDSRISTTNIARISDSDHRRLSKYHLQVGDIVYARRGDIGRWALVTSEENGWLCGTGSLFIRTGNENVDPSYLHYYLGKPEVIDFIHARAVGTTMLNLNTKILRSVPISYPKFSEQQQIAEMLLNIDIKIVAEEDRKFVLQAFFKSMLHQLMTGQLRLLSDEGLPL